MSADVLNSLSCNVSGLILSSSPVLDIILNELSDLFVSKSIPKLLYIKSFPSFRHSDEKSTKDIELIIEHIIKQKNNN